MTAGAMIQPLAQVGGAIGWSLVLVVFVVVGFFAIVRLRQWLKSDDEPAATGGFSLGALRELHRQGKMTDEEFEKARSLIVAGAKKMAEKLPDPLAGHRRAPAPPRGPRGGGGDASGAV
jgi:hypothetical protein